MYAEILIPLALPKNYTWYVPGRMLGEVQPGCRVEVEFGKKRYAGLVKRLHIIKPRDFDPKDILGVLDASPVIHADQLKLWEWISQYYMADKF